MDVLTRERRMKTKVTCVRFIVLKKGGQFLKPFLDDTPYLFFKRKKDAMMAYPNNPVRKATVTISIGV